MTDKRVQLAVNYSTEAAKLLKEQRIVIDCFKCPPWPQLVAEAQKLHPVYVHFSLKVGSGNADVIDTETRAPADWGVVESLMRQTETPFVNVHLSPTPHDYPRINIDDSDPAQIETVVEGLVRDVEVVIGRFGRERVLVENDHAGGGRYLKAGYLPAVIKQVVEETRCGFLCDLSHARIAARWLNMSEQEYIARLPLGNIREIHVTGLQYFDGQWTERLRKANIADQVIKDLDGRLMDHLPMTEEDWAFLLWAMDQICARRWAVPWVVAFEYGGVGPVWEAVTDMDALAVQVPRMRTVLERASSTH